ncbi:MAG: beta-ketoacyl-ACP synthase II [Gemmatimonadota bacterium]|nr:beta-ketoacyl-ACP synthase II [Gemmatimonadota bacterium]MDE2829618.1 beta-ketoacyl-ACP synthase II [Gemmatimonadota bacterium]
MNRQRRVVITGMGALAPNGNTTKSYWEALCNGQTGVGPITKFDATDFRVQFAAEIKNFDPEHFGIDRRSQRRMDLFTQYAIASSVQAVENAGLDISNEQAERIGVVFGSGIGGIQTFEDQHEAYRKDGPRRISPLFVPMMIPDMSAGQVSIHLGAKGPNYTTVTACASAAHAIGNAAREIWDDEADVMITGGAEAAITPMSVGGFAAARTLSTRNDTPTQASRPFDADRDGFVIGEGAGGLVLEELERATQRGATIYAEVVGTGYTGDAYHITGMAPGGEGGARAMCRAMRQAQINPEDVSYINAHGTSTPVGDPAETAAIKSVFGDYAKKLAVSSTKSMTGHLLGASGAIETIATTLAVHHNVVPPTINYETPDPECDLDYVPNEAREIPVEIAISNSFGFGGHNAVLILRKFRN